MRLRADIAYRENELALWKSELTSLEEQSKQQKQSEEWKWPLSKHEYERYSRQMIVPEFGLQGKSTSHYHRTSANTMQPNSDYVKRESCSLAPAASVALLQRTSLARESKQSV